MPRTEAQRRADAVYEKKIAKSGKYKNVACRLLAGEAEAFKARCAECGTTVNAVLTEAVKNFMKK